jgi:hypothetical protein
MGAIVPLTLSVAVVRAAGVGRLWSALPKCQQGSTQQCTSGLKT